MNPKLVGCLVGSMMIGGVGAFGVIFAGGGLIAALGAYSLTGSVSLVPIAALAFREAKPKARQSAPKPAKPATVFS